jgi:outer membrane lipoprotein SlyB
MENQVNKIEPQSGQFPQAIIWIAGIALTLFCVVGIAAVMGWIPSSMGWAGDRRAIQSGSVNTVPRYVPKVHGSAASNPEPVERAAPARTAASSRCAECGVIESVRAVEAKGLGSGLGAVGGAVVGGLLGNQMGAGRGQDVMTVVGAAGGAVAGNEVEKRVKSTRHYEITVRLNDGSSRVISETAQPVWHSGDKVRLVNGVIRSNA